MLTNERQYKKALAHFNRLGQELQDTRKRLREAGECVNTVNDKTLPIIDKKQTLEKHLQWYQRAQGREFNSVEQLGHVGEFLIALRIANGLSQAQLAEKLGVPRTMGNRNEKNHNHSLTLQAAQTILDAMGETLIIRARAKRK